jgi:hypothetical protein
LRDAARYKVPVQHRPEVLQGQQRGATEEVSP